jgi:hypothetical protein
VPLAPKGRKGRHSCLAFGRALCFNEYGRSASHASTRWETMFYFFEKDHEFVRCEIVEDAGRWKIFITEPGGHERSEQFASSGDAHSRWKELQARFTIDGWFGPYGRD